MPSCETETKAVMKISLNSDRTIDVHNSTVTVVDVLLRPGKICKISGSDMTRCLRPTVRQKCKTCANLLLNMGPGLLLARTGWGAVWPGCGLVNRKS